jgi:hypothetical protein
MKYKKSFLNKGLVHFLTLLLFISFTIPHFHYHECTVCKIDSHVLQISTLNTDDDEHEPCALCEVIQSLKLSFLVKTFDLNFIDNLSDVQIIEQEEYFLENNSLHNSRAPPFKI